MTPLLAVERTGGADGDREGGARLGRDVERVDGFVDVIEDGLGAVGGTRRSGGGFRGGGLALGVERRPDVGPTQIHGDHRAHGAAV